MKKLIYKIIYEVLKPYVMDTLMWIVAEYSSGLLSHNHLQELIRDGVITADPANVNAASIDLTLGDFIMREPKNPKFNNVVNLANKENIDWERLRMDRKGYILAPGETILAETREVFNLPDNISGEFKLKSSQARNALDHANAGWADAGWNGSVLTLEFTNHSRYHSLTIEPGMKCGQMIFFRHEPVPDHASYANRGQYNGDRTVSASKGIR